MKRIFASFSAVVIVLTFVFAAQAEERVLKPDDTITISFAKGRLVSNVRDGSIGEKMAEFEPSVKLQNGRLHDFKGNKVCLLLLGEDTTQKDNWKVMYRREFDADLLGGKTFEWVGSPFKQGFDRTLAKSGYDYDGFIILVRNSEGTIVKSASSKPAWLKNPEKAWNLVEKKAYTRDYFKDSGLLGR